jgi:hypothetical protein
VLKCSNGSQRGFSQPKLGFLTNHTNLTKRCWGELTKAYDEFISWVAPAPSKGERGKDFILVPKKLAVENWPVKTGTSGFGNRNIRNMKYSRWSSSAKPDPPVLETGPSDFSKFSEMWSVCGHNVSLISLGFLGFVEHETLFTIYVAPLFIERHT